METKHFNNQDWSRCNPTCTDRDMDPELLHMLEVARSFYDTPMIINSAYRSVAHEKAHGRAGTSSHCSGKAVDIHCLRPERCRMLAALFRAGFRRIGIYPTFIHVDVDLRKGACVWVSAETEDAGASADGVEAW